MKKLFSLIIICVFHSFAFAQFISVTPKIGMTVSNMKDYYEKYKIGYMFGAAAEYKLSAKVVLKPELLLEQKGGQDAMTFTDENGWVVGIYNVHISSNYLNLPIQLKYSPFTSNNIFFTAGGFAGYLLWANLKAVDPEGNYHLSKHIDKDFMNQWDVGFSLGSGTDIPLSEKGGIQVEIKYEHSLLNSAFFLTDNTFSLSVGYTFLTGK